MNETYRYDETTHPDSSHLLPDVTETAKVDAAAAAAKTRTTLSGISTDYINESLGFAPVSSNNSSEQGSNASVNSSDSVPQNIRDAYNAVPNGDIHINPGLRA
jgi:hypothetical protein